jgi:hypothetical protein
MERAAAVVRLLVAGAPQELGEVCVRGTWGVDHDCTVPASVLHEASEIVPS